MQKKGNNIVKLLRNELCLSQEEFAKLINVSRQTISYWECGKYKITDKYAKKIIEILKNHKNVLKLLDNNL